jgi:predicted MPP superfamily phosphohydrolase
LDGAGTVDPSVSKLRLGSIIVRGQRNNGCSNHMVMKITRALPLLLVLLLLCQLACSPTRDHTPSQPPLHSIVIYGDCRSGDDIHRQIVADALKIEPKAVFNTGDLVNDGSSASEWAIFDNITSELRQVAPYYPALGNHDLPPQLFFADFHLPNNERWYSVDIDSLHFIVLDTTSDISQGSEQYMWLEADLQSASQDFVVVVTHYPLLSTGQHGGSSDIDQILKPLFEEYHVDIVFSGHDHDYERSSRNGIYYIVTGGGGADLYSQATTSKYSQVFKETHNFCTLFVNGGVVTVEASDPAENVIDQLAVKIR